MRSLSIVLVAVLFVSFVSSAAHGRHKGKAAKRTAGEDEGTADDVTPHPINSGDDDAEPNIDEVVEFPEHNIIGKLEHGSPIKSRASRSQKH